MVWFKWWLREWLSYPCYPLCGFCHWRVLAADDVGFITLWPDGGDQKDGKLTCWHCNRGEPGQKHYARYGEGER